MTITIIISLLEKKETAKAAFAFFQPTYVKQHEGLDVYDSVEYKVVADGNVYTNGAMPGSFEANVTQVTTAEPELIFEDNGSVIFKWNNPIQKGKLITSEMLGKARVPNQRFEKPDGSPLTIDVDYFGKKRSKNNPNAGPFEQGENITVWPKR
jgi:alpha-N-arabinofuranosidase